MTVPAEEVFVMRSGRLVYNRNTDQPDSGMLIRTVSKGVDGSPTDRPKPAVQLAFAGSRVEAQNLADKLDRAGYLPPETPMSREEYETMVDNNGIGPLYAGLIWMVVGQGLPAKMAVKRVVEDKGNAVRNSTTHLRRWLKEIGWGTQELENTRVGQ